MNITTQDIHIKIRLSDKPKLLAQAEVIFFDTIEIKGWRIMPSQTVHAKFQEQLWIQPPMYKTGPIYRPIVFLNNKELYCLVEEKIYESYRLTKSKTPPSPKEVNIEDIPI